mgnify:CR=1 FL=1
MVRGVGSTTRSHVVSMINSSTSDFLHNNVKVFRSRVSKTAWQGISVAALALITATFAVAYLESGNISISSVLHAQKTNFALWIPDLVPFIFAFWG